MTFREHAILFMTKNAMPRKWADAIVNELITDDAVLAFDRWDEDASGYPDKLLDVILVGVKHAAMEYLKENHPKAWFRPCFDDELLSKMKSNAYVDDYP